MSERTRIAVLGGGYGGVEAAKKLYKHFKRKDDVEVILVDRNPYHTLMTELHEIAGSRTEPEAVQVSFRKIFAGTNVKVFIDEIESIDFDNNVMKSETTSYEYDYLIIGTGGRPEFFGIPGVQENSFTLWSLEDAIRIRTHVEERFRDAAKEPDPKNRERMLSFVIAGAGFTGIELAGELCERRDQLCPKYHIDPDEVSIRVVEMKDNILPNLPGKPQVKAAKYLKKIGCEVMLQTTIVGADEGVVRLEGDRELPTDTFIWTAGIQGSEFTAKIPLTKGRCSSDECSVASVEGIHGMAGCHFDDEERYVVGQRGRVLVNQQMQSVDYRNVYLVGDMIWFLEGDKVVPQIVETALQTAETASENVIADIEGKEKKKFESNYHGFMVSIGGRYGVAHVMGMPLSGIFAMGVKHLINMHYLLGLAGINAVWEYIQHEFLTIKDHRSFLGGHFAWKIPVYWAVPLRLWLGGKWLAEGIKHIRDGWLNPGEEGLSEVWTGAIKLPGVSFGDAGSAATPDAESAATPAAEEGAAAAAEYGEPLIEALDIYTWFAETVLSASPLLAFLLQSAVVLGQVAIGLAFIGGLMTFPAAVVSLGFSVMFIASGWGNPELLWYIMASIVMLGGAGRGFGLDHYVMPWLHKKWNGTKLAKKSYLYTGEPRP
ncbi:MAG: FAD-dependent oxidoreductase [Spirochaetota bacterium]